MAKPLDHIRGVRGIDVDDTTQELAFRAEDPSVFLCASMSVDEMVFRADCCSPIPSIPLLIDDSLLANISGIFAGRRSGPESFSSSTLDDVSDPQLSPLSMRLKKVDLRPPRCFREIPSRKARAYGE